ncbi:MAG: tetratricopeptide repeat protein [Limisphaerales bacterium]
MEPSTEDRAGRADKICAAGLWPEVLAFAQKWQEDAPTDHRAVYYLGLGLSGMGQHAQAETAFRRALAMDVTDFEIWNHLAELLYKNLRRPAEGVRCLKQALKINPQHKLGWLHLATMADDMGSHLQALEYADQAIALDPGMVEAYLHKATAARALGRMDVVKDICQHLATLEPGNFHRAP